MGARSLLPCHRRAEPDVGRLATLCRLAGRPLRSAPRTVGRQRALCHRFDRNGVCLHHWRTHRQRRTDDRTGAKRQHLQRGLCRTWQGCPRSPPRVGDGCCRRRRLFRSVLDDPDRIQPAWRPWLVHHPADLRRRRAADHPPGRCTHPRAGGLGQRRRPDSPPGAARSDA